MIVDHINVNRIVGIRIHDKTTTIYKWLPAKQKTTFFGLIKLNKWYPEGFYEYGWYIENYSGIGGGYAFTADQLSQRGYLIQDKDVFQKPYVKIYLQSDCTISKQFNSLQEAQVWVDQLKSKCKSEFEIITYEDN